MKFSILRKLIYSKVGHRYYTKDLVDRYLVYFTNHKLRLEKQPELKKLLFLVAINFHEFIARCQILQNV